MAYINDFWLMLFLTLAVTPLLLLIRPPGKHDASEQEDAEMLGVLE